MADITLEISNSAWATATAYVANQYVSNDARDYVCIAAHTSGATTEPGTGASWPTYWRQSEAKRTLMLARDNGIAMWKSYEVAQDGGNQDKPIWSQTDWSGGFGDGGFGDPSRYSVGYCIDTSHPGYFCLGPNLESASLSSGSLASYPHSFCQFGGELYMATLTAVYKWDSTNNYWVSKKACTARALCIHNDKMYVACGTSYYYTADGDTYTEVAATAYAFLSSSPYAGSTPIMWTVTGDNTIAQSDDPTNADNWAQDIYIGESSSAIVYGPTGSGLFTHQGQLYITKTDGLYHYDSDGVVHKLLDAPYRGSAAYYLPFKHVVQLKGATYFDIGTGIGELTSYNSYDRIEPTRMLEDVEVREGSCTGLAADEEALYASFYDSTIGISTIYKGVETADSEGNTKWTWHPIGTLTGVTYRLAVPMTIAGIHPRLWVGCYTSSYLCKYMKLSRNPTESTHPYSDSPSFTTTGYSETGWIDLGYRDWYKIVDSVLVECRGTMGTVAVAYQADESGSYTTIGTYTATTSGTKDYVATAPFAAKKFKLKITLTGATTASTPIVKYVAVYGSVRPNRVTLMDFTITAEEGHSASSKGLRDFLIHCRDSTGLHTLTDRFGASHYVRILPGYPTETEYLDSTRKQPALGLRVICEKVDWS